MKATDLFSMFAATALVVTALTGCGGDESADTTTTDTTAAMAPAPAPADTAMPAAPAMAENPMVGGAPMYADKDIIDNAVNSQDHTTLVTAVKAAGLVETLKGPGPFTVFAPTNAAFDKLPKGTVETLVKPENKDKLTGILTYHVVPGKMDAAAIMEAIKAGNGKAEIATANGSMLTAAMDGSDVVLTDTKGNKARVTIANVYQSNGVIHVVDAVLMPN